MNYVLYTDESPYKMQREWLDRLPFDIYSVNVHTGAKRLIGRSYRTAPKWSVNGKWAVMYDPIAQVWMVLPVRLLIYLMLSVIQCSWKVMINRLLLPLME